MIMPGRRESALVENADFGPTILDLAGVRTPAYMQGRSLVEIIKGRTPADWRTSTYYRYWMHMVSHDNPSHFGIRTADAKLIFYYGVHYNGSGSATPPAWEFYDLKNDPLETRNLYRQPAHREKIAALKIELAKKRKDLREEDGAYPRIQKIISDHWND